MRRVKLHPPHLRGKQERSQDFSKGGGVIPGQSEGTHQIVMSFLQPTVGCLLEKGLQRGTTGTLVSPLAASLVETTLLMLSCTICKAIIGAPHALNSFEVIF